MSRSLQDQFIDDDEEETCPLCVEEFDLTDRSFRPCPCGYQICQFCYHNVKNNMNCLCPACRRPYRDEDIEYKIITAEETAAHKARQAQKQKKTQAALQKEKQKAEADHLSRKHLAGLRVVQKNLVYVTGLSPTSQEDQLLQTLRGEQYFGQYGKIIKIVVSKARDPAHPHSVGVYVTYERKEDAASCIAAVDGSRNGDRTLRAQFGTTKYCSAYLRNETCANRNCMFLHEPGEANESYSRADLSALNAGSSQQGHSRPPPPQSQQPVASAAPPMARQSSTDQPSSPSLDRPALPSTASWASKPPQPSRTETRSTSSALASPAPVKSSPAHVEPESEPEIVRETKKPAVTQPPPEPSVEQPSKSQPKQRRTQQLVDLIMLLNGSKTEDFRTVFSLQASYPQNDREFIDSFPPLFDSDGGAKRHLRRQREEEQRRMEQEAQAFQQPLANDSDDNPEISGSLQLGGEPEDRPGLSQMQGAIQPPGQEGGFPFGGIIAGSTIDRGFTPQHHQQMLLQTLKPNTTGAYLNNLSSSSGLQSSFQHSSNPPGHQRNTSRYSFANDTASATAAVKPVANPKLLSQQSSMMPLAGANHFGSQIPAHSNQFYTSNVQGPPPGLKTTGTPPVSGNLTFGQGHGFATGGLQYGATTRNQQQDTYYRDLLRGRDANPSGLDAKHDKDFPPLRANRKLSITSRVSQDELRRSTPPIPPGFEAQVLNESRRSTPTIPPGLTKPTALPDLDGSASSRPSSRPSSRASLRRTASQILTAIPLRPGTPAKRGQQDESKVQALETPTKASKSSSSSDLKSTTAVVASEKKSVPNDKSANDDALGIASGKGESIEDKSPKRKHPGKLDISAATSKQGSIGGTALTSTDVETPSKASRLASHAQLTPSKISDSPAASPIVKTAPRTLRLVKTDATPSTPVAVSPLPPTMTNRIPSRQASVASIQVPGTPSSEQVSMSDNISVTSTSQSRANSPPPSKVGSAPLRVKTKSQVKKERQERAKALEEKAKSEETVKVQTEEPAQEAIVSRKKKAKKEKEMKPKAKVSPPAVEAKPVVSQSKTPPTTPAATQAIPKAEVAQRDAKPSKVATPTKIPMGPQPPPQSPSGPSPPPTPTPTAAQLIAELKASAPEIQKCIDSLFRVSNSNYFKPSQNISSKDLANPTNWKSDVKVNLTKSEVDALLSGMSPAIHYGGEGGRMWDRGMVAPSGAHLRALTKELETRFLELEKALRDMPDEFRFKSSKPQNDMKFPSIDLEALKRQFDSAGGRGVSVMEQMVQDPATMKKGAFLVDEASKYINEFIMPPATPPPSSSGSGASRSQASSGTHQSNATTEQAVQSVENAERRLNEAKRLAEEKETALKKMIKKNKRIFGLS